MAACVASPAFIAAAEGAGPRDATGMLYEREGGGVRRGGEEGGGREGGRAAG